MLLCDVRSLFDGGVDQRPEDLGEQLLAGADPAVEGGPVNAEFPGQGLHVDAVTGEKGPAGLAEGVERGRARRGPRELPLQRRARVARTAGGHPGWLRSAATGGCSCGGPATLT